MSNEWNIDKAQWRDSEPYGHKIHDFIMKYPEWCVYLRLDPRFKCPLHWDEATETHKSLGTIDCACLGLGIAVSGYIVPSKVSRGRNAEIQALEGTVREFPGYVEDVQDVIHFPREVLPQINDFVLFCEWNRKAQNIQKGVNPRPLRIHSIYIIRQINPYFQRELSHFSCGCESFGFHNEMVNRYLPEKLGNLPVIDPEKTWQQISYWSD